MEFKEIVETFAKRHGIADIVLEDYGIALDIDGIVVSSAPVGESGFMQV